MRGKKLLLTLALSAMLLSGCGLKDNSAIIKINDKAITKAQYDNMIDKSLARSPLGKMGDLKANKDGFLYLMTEQQVINQLIIQEILNQEADERNIKITDDDMNEAMKAMIEQMGGKAQLVETLRANGVSSKDFKNDLRMQVKMKKLADDAGKINISDKECEKFYNEHKSEFKYPEQVRASHILIMANEYQIAQELTDGGKKKIGEEELKAKVQSQMDEKKALAEKLDKELKADPTKFAQYAKKYSEDEATGKQGGDLGFFAKEQMVPEFGNVAFSQKPNTVSDVVKTQFGYHIIMPVDRKEAGVTTYDKAKENIRDYLQTRQRIKTLDDLTSAAKKKAKIEFMDERYNPEIIQQKLTKQVDDATNGQASKLKESSKK